MTINIKVVTTTEGMPQLRNAPQRSAAAVVIEGRPRAHGHIDDVTERTSIHCMPGLLDLRHPCNHLKKCHYMECCRNQEGEVQQEEC